MQTIDNSANQFKNITTLGNTIVEGSKELIALVINTKGASSNTTKIYLGTTVDPQSVIGTIDSTTALGRLDYGIPCPTGILVVTATGTAPDITLIYRTL